MAETALLESESHHRTIFEKSPFGMVRFGKDGSVMDCNEMFTKLMGAPREQLLGFNAVQNLEDERMKSAVIKALSGKTSEFEGEYTSLMGRTTHYLRIVYNPMEPNRSPTEVIAAVEDITDRRQAEESLKNKLEEVAQARLAMLNIMEDLGEARQEAEAATRAKSDFLANMSHEIRTPMNAIIGMTHLAMRTDLTRKQQDYLKKIEIAAHSLLGVINDILDFSKIEAGKLDMEAIDFDLEEVMDHLSNLVTIKAQEKGLEFLIDMGVDVPMDLLGDPLRLGQVLINLTNNAVKFTEKGEIVVLVELMETYQERVKLKFSVRDSGIGMTQEQVDKLFTAFYPGRYIHYPKIRRYRPGPYHHQTSGRNDGRRNLGGKRVRPGQPFQLYRCFQVHQGKKPGAFRFGGRNKRHAGTGGGRQRHLQANSGGFA